MTDKPTVLNEITNRLLKDYPTINAEVHLRCAELIHMWRTSGGDLNFGQVHGLHAALRVIDNLNSRPITECADDRRKVDVECKIDLEKFANENRAMNFGQAPKPLFVDEATPEIEKVTREMFEAAHSGVDLPRPENDQAVAIRKKDYSLRLYQTNLPWSIRYSTDFRSSPMAHKDFAHALHHVSKAAGKLHGLVDDMDHDRAVADDPTLRETYGKYVADLVVCALRMANTFPGGVLDLQYAVHYRIEDKNGVKLP
jgi:hypothetical protein